MGFVIVVFPDHTHLLFKNSLIKRKNAGCLMFGNICLLYKYSFKIFITRFKLYLTDEILIFMNKKSPCYHIKKGSYTSEYFIWKL